MTGPKTNNLSDAIRNLIVCDTQFGWSGETTLKLPELLDLQARGWLIEGSENNEFSLTDEGQAVVERALQQAGPAELAEQQASVLYSVARDLMAEAYKAGRNGIGFSEQVMRLDEALSATGKQQVGEVQGDARGLLDRYQSAIKAFEYSMSDDGYNDDARIRLRKEQDAVRDEVLSALAARQPVDYHGDVDLKRLAGSIGEVAHRLRTYMPNLAEWADRARDCGIAAQVLEDLAARQPGVQEPVDDDWHLRGYAYASKQATTCASCGKHKHTPLRIDAMGGYVCLTCIDQKLGALLGEFGYPPAQGIDLGRALDIMWNWQEQLGGHVFDARDVVRTLTSSDMQAIGVDARACIDATDRNQAIVLAKREIVRALSSGQRDAAPGVHRG